jgi:type I restriction enzyme, R subunit
MNQLFEGDLSEADVLAYATHIRDKLLENPVLAQQAASNSKEQFAMGNFQSALMQAVVGGLGSYKAMATQVLQQPHVKEGFGKLLLDLVYEAFQTQ